jgi:hypothetical protein
VTAAIADVLSERRSLETVRRKLSAQARDLGPAGPDDAFGYGLLRHTLSCEAGTSLSELSRE